MQKTAFLLIACTLSCADVPNQFCLGEDGDVVRVCPTGWSCSADGSACIDGACGNGVIEGNEQCDDGNVISGDGCSANCTSDETCGNGEMDPGEVCDERTIEDTETCGAHCKSLIKCGDGFRTANEACDGGEGCTPDCKFSVCGDGFMDSTREECDPKLQENCSESCKLMFYGNGVIDPGELCDDGNTDDQDYCIGGQLAVCGDSVVREHPDGSFPREECDSGESDSTTCNGANAPEAVRCRFSVCGDGYRNAQAGEECDPQADGPDGENCHGLEAPTATQCKRIM